MNNAIIKGNTCLHERRTSFNDDTTDKEKQSQSSYSLRSKTVSTLNVQLPALNYINKQEYATQYKKTFKNYINLFVKEVRKNHIFKYIYTNNLNFNY